ncbi:class I SAM-dependent methyltransferase [Methylobacterium currus]|uniref:Class I SAM-dependent methyltransferase n=2 Tax=Methylobacterium TaxID=407 RepID=A0A2R4WRZ1_9HYPH|nr:class I SAM-dependent methyltransferase [Methylobacterium currus]
MYPYPVAVHPWPKAAMVGMAAVTLRPTRPRPTSPVASIRTVSSAMALILGARRWIARRGFERTYPVLMRDPACTEPLIAALAPEAGERILYVRGPQAEPVLGLAKRFPGTKFVGLEADAERAAATRADAAAAGLTNVKAFAYEAHGRLPFPPASFDKAASVMALHSEPPEGKLRIARELLRVLRRQGSLLASDLDAARGAQEGALVKVASMMLGEPRLQPHTDGTWPDILSEAGFARVKRLGSHSVLVARVALVRASRR